MPQKIKKKIIDKKYLSKLFTLSLSLWHPSHNPDAVFRLRSGDVWFGRPPETIDKPRSFNDVSIEFLTSCLMDWTSFFKSPF